MEGLLACLCSGPCGTTLATAFGSDLRSVDTLRSSRVALTQPDAYGAGESRMTTNSFASHLILLVLLQEWNGLERHVACEIMK